MHVLYVHKNFPAQFGHLGSRLVRERAWRCTFVSEHPSETVGGITRLKYTARGAATERTHFAARTFENGCWHAHGVFEALETAKALVQPDLIVHHSGFGSTLFLPELFPDVPLVGFFEWWYRPRGTDLDFRADRPVRPEDRLRAHARNAMILLDLEQATLGYAPTAFQRSMLPATYDHKLRTLHDGIDTGFWYRREVPGRQLGGLRLDEGQKLVTYVSRGLESVRGFDVFMRLAKRLTDAREDVVVVVVGRDRVAYGGDDRLTGGRSFKQWVLAQDRYDLSRIRFSDAVPPDTLAQLLSLSDLHVYLTVPFVLSWSCLDAMACEAPLLGSATPPVEEVVEDGVNGRLAPFLDVDALTERALELLDDPEEARRLGRAARETVVERYALDRLLPEHAAMYEEAVAAAGR